MTRNRVWTLVGVALLVTFAGFAGASFFRSLTPYVSFDDARRGSRAVQVAGALEKGTASYDEAAEALLFTLVDAASGAELPVRYHGVRPANFEDAISIVAIGKWDGSAREFAAAKLLVKCPSKYQGAEVKTYS